MSRVYLHNSTYASREEALLAWDASRSELQVSTFWNIWKKRGVGSAIEDGTRILLVGGWPAPGGTVHHVLWDARAWDVHKWDGIDWDTAVRRLGRWTGAGVAAIREDDYTASKRDAGSTFFVMGWRPELVTWIDRPLPDDVRISRNGWAAFDETEVAKWRLTAKSSRGSKGQGRQLDPASRKAIENRAMAVARKWCVEQGWTHITDTSSGRPWDYEARDAAGEQRYVEVKGSVGTLTRMEVTIGEVNAARAHRPRHILIAVRNIKLTRPKAGSAKATGGLVSVFDPWTPSDRELAPTKFDWTPDRSSGT